MDLPTCPSCGQSVLDDDAEDCPFCGASMSGKAAPRKAKTRPAAEKSKATADSTSAPKPEKEKSAKRRGRSRPVADDDDPFDLGAGPVAGNVVAARPKASKGRLHRVICPMCDTAGFVPKSAKGKQIRCANPECLVPVFTAPGPGDAGDTRSRATESDAAASAGDGVAPSAGSPMKIYIIAGGVLLFLGAGLIYFLNRPADDPSEFDKPAEIDWSAIAQSSDTETDSGDVDSSETAVVERTPQQKAERLVKRMISTARLDQNREKALARRMTADSYVRLRQPGNAAQELNQLVKVSRQVSSDRTWIQIEPRLTQYWMDVADGDVAAAGQAYQGMLPEANRIRTAGRLALETVIGVAAAMVNEQDLDAAMTLVNTVSQDRTVISNRDVVSSAAWFQSVSRMRDAGLTPFTVGDVFAWEDALRTGVAVDLASHGNWTGATQWSTRQPGNRVVGDCLTAVAEIACDSAAGSDALDSISAAADAAGPGIALRVNSLIAGKTGNAALLKTCSDQLQAVTIPDAATLPSLTQLIRTDSTRFDMGPRLMAAAAAEFARAAVLLGDDENAQLGIRHLHGQLSSIVAATPVVRRAILELEQNESRVKKRISTEMRVSASSEIASQFRKYRRILDQYAVAAERRRLYLMQRLARIVRSGGAAALLSVMDDDTTGLKQEVVMDGLARLLVAAAVRSSQELPPIRKPDASLIVRRPQRMEAMPEAAISSTLMNAWTAADDGRLKDAVRTLNSGRDLPGFREALLNEIIEEASQEAAEPTEVYAAIGDVRNPVWREEALRAAGRVFARRGMTSQVEAWLDGEKVPPTELVAGYYGLVLGLLEQ